MHDRSDSTYPRRRCSGGRGPDETRRQDHRADVWAAVVARVGAGAKSRLADVLSAAERSELALAMLGDVLDVCCRGDLGGAIAVVDTVDARSVAALAGAIVVADHGRGDMNAAASL